MSYGQEVIIDVHESVLFDRRSIECFCLSLCGLLDMEPEDLNFWDYDGQPEEYAAAPAHLKGTSAVQFIRTSNITIHALDEMRQFHLNVFSCKPFDPLVVRRFVEEWTGGEILGFYVIPRV